MGKKKATRKRVWTDWWLTIGQRNGYQTEDRRMTSMIPRVDPMSNDYNGRIKQVKWSKTLGKEDPPTLGQAMTSEVRPPGCQGLLCIFETRPRPARYVSRNMYAMY